MSPLTRWIGSRRAQAEGVLRTARLALRPLGHGDVARIAVLAGDWDVASMTARVPYPYTEADARHWLDFLEPGEVVRGIECDGELIGLTGYAPEDNGRSAEIGYWIGKPHWGHGYATEAAGALIAHCFSRQRFERLTCCHFADNAASARVIAKLGFRSTGSCRCWCEARRREAEAIRYELARPLRLRGRSVSRVSQP